MYLQREYQNSGYFGYGGGRNFLVVNILKPLLNSEVAKLWVLLLVCVYGSLLLEGDHWPTARTS